MNKITLPQMTKYTEIEANKGEFTIEKCYPGYGTTVGNALRRVLLSSLNGSAVSAVKTKGVSHEFSTIEDVKEDMVQIILNLKKVRFQSFSDEPVKVTLKHKGNGEITADEIICPSDVKVVNGDAIIATATSSSANVDMEIEISKGIGYVPAEQQERDDEVGVIGIDAIYTPIKSVNYRVENMRVGKKTDYDRIVLELSTDGSITPEEAFEKAVGILVSQFTNLLKENQKEEEVTNEKEEADVIEKKKDKEAQAKKKKEASDKKKVEADSEKIKINELKGLSTRTVNALEANKLSTIKDITEFTAEELIDLEGMGEKGVKEIRKAVGTLGLVLEKTKVALKK